MAMTSKLNISFFGSSLVSAYWNGAATYYRGLIRALHEQGHRVTFFEPDAYQRQQHRDIPDPDWARVIIYPARGEKDAFQALGKARGSDLVIKASGIGIFDAVLEEAVLELQSPKTLVVFLDVDAPATLDRIRADPADPFRKLIPHYDLVLTYGGGDSVVHAYLRAGARHCVPIYNALDPYTHFPVPAEARFAGVLGFLGNRMPDREPRVDEFFFKPAMQLQDRRFLLGGNGWQTRVLPANVGYVGHVYTRDHNAFNCGPLAVLNINRGSMARYGFSPPTRVFEAAGAGACLITDRWQGMDLFLEPGCEVLVAADGDGVAEHLRQLTPARARAIGRAARRRVLAEHTYFHRVAQLEEVLDGHFAPPSTSRIAELGTQPYAHSQGHPEAVLPHD
jgi:spore maturation protein CgeB